MELLDDDWVAVGSCPTIVANKEFDLVDGLRSFGDDQIEVLIDEDNKCVQLFYFCQQNNEIKKFDTRFQMDSLSTLHLQLKTMVEYFEIDPPAIAIATQSTGV